MGLLYGTTVCSLTCLPYLGLYLLSTGRGFTDGVKSSLLFLSGKLICYTFAGGLSAYLGSILMPEESIFAKQIMGIAIIAFGLSIFLTGRNGHCSRIQGTGKTITLFITGVSTSLIPCPPLITMLLLAAKSGSFVSGATYGMVYGLGIAISPLIIACGGLSLISKTVKKEAGGIMPYLQGISAVMIVIMGVKILM